jgi:hypothetical protein
MKVLEKQISENFLEMNRKALDLGLNLVEDGKLRRSINAEGF